MGDLSVVIICSVSKMAIYCRSFPSHLYHTNKFEKEKKNTQISDFLRPMVENENKQTEDFKMMKKKMKLRDINQHWTISSDEIEFY